MDSAFGVARPYNLPSQRVQQDHTSQGPQSHSQTPFVPLAPKTQSNHAGYGVNSVEAPRRDVYDSRDGDQPDPYSRVISLDQLQQYSNQQIPVAHPQAPNNSHVTQGSFNPIQLDPVVHGETIGPGLHNEQPRVKRESSSYDGSNFANIPQDQHQIYTAPPSASLSSTSWEAQHQQSPVRADGSQFQSDSTQQHHRLPSQYEGTFAINNTNQGSYHTSATMTPYNSTLPITTSAHTPFTATVWEDAYVNVPTSTHVDRKLSTLPSYLLYLLHSVTISMAMLYIYPLYPSHNVPTTNIITRSSFKYECNASTLLF
jgi:hypothetical protein